MSTLKYLQRHTENSFVFQFHTTELIASDLQFCNVTSVNELRVRFGMETDTLQSHSEAGHEHELIMGISFFNIDRR